MTFCAELMERANTDENFIKSICFTDESTFPLFGKHNSAVVRYWSRTNPRRRVDYRTQYPQKLNVWAGMVGNYIIGPFFINGTLNGVAYVDLLSNQIIPALQALPDVNINSVWYQQDGCPAHNTAAVRRVLNNTFPRRLIANRGDIHWPARSPDLSPNDFFLWGYIKQLVYGHQRANTLEQLQEKIVEAFARVTPVMLHNMRRSFYDRLGFCSMEFGGLFEHLI